MKTVRVYALLLSLSVAWPAVAQHEHGGDFLIGVHSATNQLTAEYDPGNFPLALPPSEDPLLPGWTLDDPGLIALDGSDPEHPEFVPVDPDARIGLELLAVSSPAMKLWSPLGPGEAGFQILPGTIHVFQETGDFHEHPWWHIDSSEPAFDPLGAPWELTFRLVDLRTSTLHMPSDAITVAFVPEPGAAAALLSVTGLGTLVRRGRAARR